ncbi:MAG: isoamylase early set domain-containing protein [Desulfosarcinaceae bacterium]|nr:isoamylase early set domain-containing protein [Desulfosarcinaceae bacterium]
MSLKKRYLKSKPVCKVTFRVPREVAKGAGAISIVGEFNDWQPGVTPMKSLKSGEFTATVDLAAGREYQFRYLIDGDTWENDGNADKYVRTCFGDSDNSVVIV